jgi:hypothetical protein
MRKKGIICPAASAWSLMASRIKALFGPAYAMVFAIILLACAPVRAEPPSFDRRLPSPPPAEGPIRVKVGLYVLNLVALDEVQQTFTFTAYLTESWNDPRLAFTPRADENGDVRHYYIKSSIWFPLLQIDNSAEPRKVSGYLLSGVSDGSLQYTEKISVRVSSNMQLRAFPFDSQDLEVAIRPFTFEANRIVLTIDQRSTGLSKKSYTPLPLWQTGTVTYRAVGEQKELDEGVSHIEFRVHVGRKSEYYIYRIFLPLALMVAVSWGILWVPPSDLNSQLLISVTTLLTLVAFSVALSNILPPVPYLTFYDGFFLDAFFFIMISMGESLVIHSIFHGKGHEAAVRQRRRTRMLLPLMRQYQFWPGRSCASANRADLRPAIDATPLRYSSFFFSELT